MNLKEILREINQDSEEIYSLEAKVIEVDKINNTCDVQPLDGSPDIYGVKLSASEGAGVVFYPLIDSVVIVSFLDRNNGFVTMFSELDVLSIETENESLKTLLNDLISEITKLTVPTPTGVSSTPVNTPQFTAIKNRLDKLFHK